MKSSSANHYTSTLTTADWHRALDDLRCQLPSLDRIVTGPSALSADLIHDLVEVDRGLQLTWRSLDSQKRSDREIAETTCVVDFHDSATVFIVNDFTYAADLGPFVTEGKQLFDWFGSYRSRVSPSLTPFDGDLIVWSKAGLYIVSHERVYASLRFSLPSEQPAIGGQQ